MKQKIIAIYSNKSNLKKFSKEHFETCIPRNFYLHLPIFNKRFPYFISNNSCHEEDINNIKSVLRKKKLKKSNLSIVIFDAHTDMYRDIEKSILTENKVNMANWVMYLLNSGYNDISILGVSDFTKTRGGNLMDYKKFQNEITFFVGRDFEDRGDIKVKSLEDFLDKRLRKYTFVSLDCDCSNQFTKMNQKYVGYYGEMQIPDICNSLQYIKENSKLIGLSVYGMYDTFLPENKNNVLNILKNIHK